MANHKHLDKIRQAKMEREKKQEQTKIKMTKRS